MNNFINLRLKAHNHTKTFSSIKHNLRHIKTLSEKDDLSSDRKHTQENYFFYNDELIKLEKNKAATKYFYDFVAKQYKEDRKEHNQIWLAANENNKDLKGRNLKNSKATWLEGVFTFSEQFKHDLGNKYSLEELTKIAYECLEDVAKKIGADIKYLIYHGDETTGHYHYSLSNFDNKGLSLFHKIKNKEDLSNLQDIAFKHFSKLGMNRGIKKDNSIRYDYISPKEWHKKELLQIKDEISLKSNEMIKIDESIKELKTLRNNISKSSKIATNEKKIIYDEITNAQKQLRSLRKNFQIEKKSYLEFQAKLEDLFKKHHSRFNDNSILKEKILEEFGDDIMLKASNKKLELQNQNLKKQVEYLQKLSESKIDFQNALIVEQEKNKMLKNDLDNAKNTINHQKEKLNYLDNENDILKNKIGEVENTSNKESINLIN